MWRSLWRQLPWRRSFRFKSLQVVRFPGAVVLMQRTNQITEMGSHKDTETKSVSHNKAQYEMADEELTKGLTLKNSPRFLYGQPQL